MKTLIREFTKEDINKWDKVMAASFPRKKDFCNARWLRRYWKSIKGWVLTDEAGEWIGATTILDNYTSKFNDGGIHFLELCVLPEYRNGAYALKLIQEMFDYAKGRTKTADVNPENKLMISLIEAFGFVEAKRTRSWVSYACDKNHNPEDLNFLAVVRKIKTNKNN